MRISRLTTIAALVASLLTTCVRAVDVNDAERSVSQQWFDSSFDGGVANLPFSFKLGEESSADVLKRAKVESSSKQLDGGRTEKTITWTDDQSGLETKVVAVRYAEFPTVEWTVYLHNGGDKETPVLSDIEGVDVELPTPAGSGVALHHQKGSNALPIDFEPYVKELAKGEEAKFAAAGGRGTNGDWPYFNAHCGRGGLIFVMGWPGQWDLSVKHTDEGKLALRGGQEETRFKLLPGETARTPLIVLQAYEGDWIRGQNIWRHWMVEHVLPRPKGKLPPPQMVACSSHAFNEMLNANEENQKHFIDRYLEEKFPLDYWWMDAGWYPNDGTWVTTGTWEVDQKRFPRGLRAVTDHGHSKGVKSIVWFEPERVAPNSWLYNERPEWLLTPPKNPGGQAYDERWRLLNLANDEAREWLTRHVNDLIDSEGIDLYRQDFNVDPLMFWRSADGEDRAGITENKYVQGYLAYWDGLLAEHPGLRIDNCASGGRRIDLETMRRSVPLLRSDHLFEPTGQQAHHYGLSLWIPYHGTGTLVGKSAIGLNTDDGVKEYDFRSHMSPSLNTCWNLQDHDLDYDKMRRLIGEFKQISPLYLGDFFPLTAHSLDPSQWMAWQYVSQDGKEAVVQAFRRQDNQEGEKPLKLSGLARDAEYRVEALGTDESWTAKGAELMDEGLTAKLEPRSAGLYLLTKE